MKKRALVAAAIVIVGIQFIPVERNGLPPQQPLQAPAEVLAVLQRSCFDCHSAATDWPWYSRIAPVSWYTAHHVEEAREHLDFSRWGLMSATEIARAQDEILEEVEEGAMPLPIYLAMHDEAEIDAADLEVLRRWAGHDREIDH